MPERNKARDLAVSEIENEHRALLRVTADLRNEIAAGTSACEPGRFLRPADLIRQIPLPERRGFDAPHSLSRIRGTPRRTRYVCCPSSFSGKALGDWRSKRP